MKKFLFLPLLLLLGLPAMADAFTVYCIANTSACSSTAPATGDYFTLASSITTAGNTFDYKLNVAYSGTNGGYLQMFSAQLFFGGSASVSNLQWVQNPGNWTTLAASKGGVSGSCNGNTPGATCGAVGTGTRPLIDSNGVTLEITGNFAGTLYNTDGTWNIQAGSSLNKDGTGGNVLAASSVVAPEPASMALLGASVLLAGIRRFFGK